jgi:hypothetical protein
MSRKNDGRKRDPETADREKAFTHNFAHYYGGFSLLWVGLLRQVFYTKNHWDAAACKAASRLLPPRRNGCRSSFV